MGLDQPDPAAGVVFYARCALSVAAHAADLAAIDTVCLAVRDQAAFRADAQLGASLGFEGKLCIHPSQVAIANEVFAPTIEQIERAQRVVTAWTEAQAEGRGVFSLDGQMIDAPVAAAQQRVLERARKASAIPDSE
jgi:citrate lyase subunit beta/citryl-CoA lyase